MDNEISLKIGEALQEWAQDRVDNAQLILNQSGIKNGSMLGQSIQTSNMKVDGISYEIGFIANDYYKFVDQGVAGVGGGLSPKKNSGLYKFKNKNISPDMVESLMDWMVRRGIVAQKRKAMVGVKTMASMKSMSKQGFSILLPQKKPIGTTKRKKWAELTKTEQNKRAATGMAIAIKMNGLKQTDFWSNTFNEAAYNDLASRIEAKLETQIELTLTIE